MASRKIQNERIVEKNITVRCDGFSYRVRLTINGARINQTFDTLQEARAYRDRMRADAATDPTHRLVIEAKQRKEEAAKLTLSDLLDRYRDEITPTKKSAPVEVTKIAKLKRYEISRLPVALVGRDAIVHFMSTARREKWSDNNLRKYLMLLSAVFEAGKKRWGMNLDNPIRKVEIPSNGKARERRLENGEFERLNAELKKARNPFMSSIFEFAVETASRRGEILKLKRKDIDLKNATAILRDTKNGESRVIPLSNQAIRILEGLPAAINGLVFPVTEEQLRQAFVAAKTRARKKYEAECASEKIDPQPGYISTLRFHDLRHEATSRFFEKELNLMEVASITGHKTLQMLKRYTHLRATELARKLN
ncbi:MAG: site-specific recombinase, phage integrase family [Burkholderiaceae bacterium]|nr:site-specific recombinase, phage integrase family [Burkholderiaceae bacterium]